MFVNEIKPMIMQYCRYQHYLASQQVRKTSSEFNTSGEILINNLNNCHSTFIFLIYHPPLSFHPLLLNRWEQLAPPPYSQFVKDLELAINLFKMISKNTRLHTVTQLRTKLGGKMRKLEKYVINLDIFPDEMNWRIH